MFKKLFFLLISLKLFSINCYADTIRLMQYNLLYYTYNATYTDCNIETNNLDSKDHYLRNIINYVKPDIFCVNEIGKEQIYANRIINNVLNHGGEKSFATIPATFSWSTIANRIFYDTQKFTYYNSFYVWTPITYINGYKLYYNSQELAQGDTTFLTVVVLHLKSGSYPGNQTARYEAMQDLMNQLESMGMDNYILSGDFNCYSHLDSGIVNALYWENPSFRFYDPLNKLGNWGSNSYYSEIHTQSTHAGFDDACFSGGGMDDRFDFILVSPYVNYGLQGVQSINSSYRTLGQDGLRYRKGLLDPVNTSAPPDVLMSLYGTSDHLPVYMDFELNATMNSSLSEYHTIEWKAKAINPIQENLDVILESNRSQFITCQLYTIEGKLLDEFTYPLNVGINHIDKKFSYPSGSYVLRLIDNQHNQIALKLFK